MALGERPLVRTADEPAPCAVLCAATEKPRDGTPAGGSGGSGGGPAAHLVLGRSKSLRVYSTVDGSLERQFAPGGAVKALAAAPDADALLVLMPSECPVYSLSGRRRLLTFKTTSVYAGSGAGRWVVVASKRRLRFALLPAAGIAPVRERHDDQFQSLVQELPLAARAVAINSEGSALCALASSGAAVVDFVARRVFNVALPADSLKSWPSKVLVACVPWGAVLIVHKRGFFISMTGKITAEVSWDTAPSSVAPVSEFLGVLVGDQLEIRNPITGTLLTSDTSDALYLQPDLAVAASAVSELNYSVTADDVLSLPPKEASTLVSQRPDLRQDPRVKALEQDRAKQLLHDGDTTAALALYNDAETDPTVVVAALRPLVDAVPSTLPKTNAEISSVFSARSSRSDVHPVLDAAAKYLTKERRRLTIDAASTGVAIDEKKATAVDTLLFHVYMKLKSPLIRPLVRLANHCDSKEVTKSLLEAGKWKELVAFYATKNQHEDALSLLVEKGDDDMLFEYFEPLPARDKPLAAHLARLFLVDPLRHNPAAAKDLFFIDMQDSALEIYDLLAGVDKPTAVQFLENQVELGSTAPQLHTLLGQEYISENSDKLCDFLSTSNVYDARSLLAKVPPQLKRARALLHGRLHEHAQALDLLVELADFAAAQSYAAREGPQALQVYLALLLKNGDAGHLADLLNTHGATLDFAHVLSQLPADMSVKALSPFLTTQTAQLGHSANQSALVSGLRRVYLAESASKLADARQLSATVTAETPCDYCHARLGTSVLGMSPQGVVHYGCLQAAAAAHR